MVNLVEFDLLIRSALAWAMAISVVNLCNNSVSVPGGGYHFSMFQSKPPSIFIMNIQINFYVKRLIFT